MQNINVLNIIEQWDSLTPQLRLESRHIYREAMSKIDLVAQWDNMTAIQKLYIADLHKTQRKEKYKIHKKRAEVVTEDKTVKTDTFNHRFILNIMNRYAPKGYKFIITGDDRRIAIEAPEIMGNQSPRGAFISDISFDMIEGVYGSLFKNDKETFNSDIIYWRMRGFTPEKPYRTTKEKHAQYVKTLESISRKSIPCIETIQPKPNMLLFRKNAIIVQGIMDTGAPAPKYLNDRLHDYVNGIVWWSFNRAMRELKASKLLKYRNSYKKSMSKINVTPGSRSGFTMWRDEKDLQRTIKLRNRLETLQYDVLPKAIEDKKNTLIMQTKQEITKITAILGTDYKTAYQPARSLLKNTFYTKTKKTNTSAPQVVECKFPQDMSALKQFWLLVMAREQKTK